MRNKKYYYTNCAKCASVYITKTSRNETYIDAELQCMKMKPVPKPWNLVIVSLPMDCLLSFSCLRAIRTLQKFGHLPSDATVFRSYAQHGVFRDIRLVAIESLVDFIKSNLSLFQLRENSSFGLVPY